MEPINYRKTGSDVKIKLFKGKDVFDLSKVSSLYLIKTVKTVGYWEFKRYWNRKRGK